MGDGIQLIIEERYKQLMSDRNVAYDVAHNGNNELVSAMMLLVASISFKRGGLLMPNDAFDDLRPETWDKGRCLKYVNETEVEQLKMIGAFAAAEIDRLQNTQ